jgi:hypothetical protein
MSVRVRLLLGAACLVLAAMLGLLATDVLRWRSTMDADDTRFGFTPAAGNLWRPAQLMPFGATKTLLGLDDDVEFRRGLRLFVLGQPRTQPYSDTEVIGLRGQAQEVLAEVVQGHSDPRRRSSAANLIGALGFANAALDASEATAYLTQAVDDFNTAISIDPENADAKYNLELALARLETAKRTNGGTQPPQDTKTGAGSGAGTGRLGSGY